jgi:hypothetical protein
MPSNIQPNSRAAKDWNANEDRRIGTAMKKMQLNKPTARQEKTYNENIGLIDNGDIAINTIDYALNLSKTAFEGIGALERSNIQKYNPLADASSKQAAINTGLMNNAIQEKALSALKVTFGGMPSEGERKILLEIQGSANLPRQEREAIWERAKQLVLLRRKKSMEQILQYEKFHHERYHFNYASKKRSGVNYNVKSGRTSTGNNKVLQFDAKGELVNK